MNHKDIIYNASYVIIKNNNIQQKHYKSSLDTMYQIASCSKFITALLVAKFYELKLLDYDTDINNYLKVWTCTIPNITLRHLLTHRSGSTDSNGYLGMPPQFKMIQNLNHNTEIISGDFDFKPFNVKHKPGEVFQYSGAGYQVIQQVLEEITGIPLYKLLKQYLFKPLNMQNSTGKLLYENKHKYKLADLDGFYRMYAETAAAGIWMSTGDLMTLSLDILNGYNHDKSKLLSQKTIRMITEGKYSAWPGVSYGLGMYVIKNKFGHGGSNYGYNMHYYCIPEKNYISIVLTCYNPKYQKSTVQVAKSMLKF